MGDAEISRVIAAQGDCPDEAVSGGSLLGLQLPGGPDLCALP